MAEKEDYTKDVGPAGPEGPGGPTGATGATGATGPPGTTTWAGITDKPSAFAPETHKTSHETGADVLTAFIQHALATAVNDFLVASGSGAYVKKTLAEAQAILIPPHFQKAKVRRNAAQSIPHNAWTKVEIDTDDFDPSNISDLTNHRIIPTKAGYYMVLVQAGLAEGGITGELIVSIYLNGSEVNRGSRITSTQTVNLNGSGLIYCNGSTDYLELFVYQWNSSTGAARNLEVGSEMLSWISAVGPF